MVCESLSAEFLNDLLEQEVDPGLERKENTENWIREMGRAG